MGNIRSFSSHTRWTESEVSIVRQHYASSDYKTILELLPNRTIGQISNKANMLGIRRAKPPKMTPDQVREAKRLQMAKRREADPEGCRAYQNRKYHQRRGDYLAKMKSYQRRRFFWRRACKLDGVTARDLASLWKSQRGLCALTGRKMDRSAQVDHILPRAKGGGDDIRNLRWVCEEANLSKRHMTDAQFLILCADVMSWIGRRIQEAYSR
jgi:5-methylcytosine-specific restriction endonuclease McrA